MPTGLNRYKKVQHNHHIETNRKGKAVSIESSAGFGWMILFNTSSPGGHVWSEAKGRSLCGVEKRFPCLTTEVHGLDDAEFAEWWKNNSDFCCRTCAARYKRCIPNPMMSRPHGGNATPL